jgi:mRNA interferase RelE/StbE
VSRRAEREISRLTPQYQVRIARALDALAEFPQEGDLRKLRGSRDDWRLRVGDLRVRFRLDTQDRTVVVLGMQPRDKAYR